MNETGEYVSLLIVALLIVAWLFVGGLAGLFSMLNDHRHHPDEDDKQAADLANWRERDRLR